MAVSGETVYALRYFVTAKIEAVPSSKLITKFPEVMVSFLENQIEFYWPQSNGIITNDSNVSQNGAYISACTNQGQSGIKYLVSRRDEQFLRVVSSRVVVQFAPEVVIRFLESKLDFNDCHAFPPKGFSSEFIFFIFDFQFSKKFF